MSKTTQPRTRQFIVDADIMRAVSQNGKELATQCLDVLDTILQAGHEVIRTPAIEAEWDKHASDYALRWIVRMQSRRRLIDTASIATGLAGALANLPVPAAEQKIMLKDCHLLEAALASDQRIISKDEAAYYHFYHASVTISQLRTIMWASPVREADACAEWLAAGAKPQTRRKIGRRPHRSHPDF